MRIAIPRVFNLPTLLFFVATGVLFVGCSGGEPRYQGKTLSKWLILYQNAEEAGPAERQAEEAIRAIGTNALPYLTKWIASDDPEPATQAKEGFKILGPVAAPAVPALTGLLTSTNELVAGMAASALASVGAPAVPAMLAALTNRSYKISLNAILALPELGTNALPAIPILRRELEHPNHVYRERAADALGNLRLEPDLVVPALTNLLQDPSPAARNLAIGSLGRFGPAARSAVPVIRPFLEYPDFKFVASKALKAIAPEVLNQ